MFRVIITNSYQMAEITFGNIPFPLIDRIVSISFEILGFCVGCDTVFSYKKSSSKIMMIHNM